MPVGHFAFHFCLALSQFHAQTSQPIELWSKPKQAKTKSERGRKVFRILIANISNNLGVDLELECLQGFWSFWSVKNVISQDGCGFNLENWACFSTDFL